jgi:hypothetical protein
VHEGHHPTSSEAEASISALHHLVTHIADRTAARAQRFPRTALVLVGRSGLEPRGAWGKVLATARSADAAGEDTRAEYLTWLKGDS